MNHEHSLVPKPRFSGLERLIRARLRPAHARFLAGALGCACVGFALLAPASALAAPPSRAPEQARYVEGLVARAKARRLFDDETWRRLLHYRPTLFGGFRSEADAPGFFLAPDGKSSPAAELEATIRGFFGSGQPRSKLEPALCRYPARFLWLRDELGLDPSRLPRQRCPRFQEFYSTLDPDSLVLVFSSYYLNNPASAFGHTFLRVNKAGRSRAQAGLELLDYGIDYSATVDTSNALIYAFKGLTGLFPGTFRKVPYYLKVREYNDYESRDLWEYELALSRRELDMVIAHLWELGGTHFDYFYLSENCSYHILAALEVANPRFHLLERVGWPVIPADTVKAVVAEPGLVRRVDYRPSNRAQARHRLQGLSGTELDLVAALLDDANAALPRTLSAARTAAVLDAALDVVAFEYARDLVREPGQAGDGAGSALEQRLLERRALVFSDVEETEAPPPLEKMPHRGHGSARFGLGSGFLETRGAFHVLDLRAALHDLADPAAGYPEEAAIEFLPLRLRYYVERPAFSLEELDLVRVTSLAPLERFIKKWSWTLGVGAERIRDAGCAGCLAGHAEFGAGATLAPFGPDLLVWAFAEAKLAAPVPGGLADTIRAGLGPRGGLRVRLLDDLALLATASWHWLPGAWPESTWKLGAVARFQYVEGFALSLEAAAEPDAMSAQALSLIYF